MFTAALYVVYYTLENTTIHDTSIQVVSLRVRLIPAR
jgi:hypothetical protein